MPDIPGSGDGLKLTGNGHRGPVEIAKIISEQAHFHRCLNRRPLFEFPADQFDSGQFFTCQVTDKYRNGIDIRRPPRFDNDLGIMRTERHPVQVVVKLRRAASHKRGDPHDIRPFEESLLDDTGDPIGGIQMGSLVEF